MKDDAFNTLEKDDISVCDGIDSVLDDHTISFLLITHFDINRKFGLNLKDRDYEWDNLYADYNPFDDELRLMYYICEDPLPNPIGREYVPTTEERDMIVNTLNQTIVETEGMNCKAYLENLMAQKTNMDYERIKNLFGKSLCYIGESENGEELYDTFHNEFGMSDEEISAMGFDSLSEFFDRDIGAEQGIKMM